MGEMRDRRKTAAYFEAYIACEKGRLEKKLEKVKACTDREQAARVWNSIFLYRMNLLLASFSAGADRDELKELYEAACEAACRISSLSYGDALVLSCFSVMLGSFSAMKPVAGLFESVFTMDKLLGGLRSYPESGHAVWQGEYRFPEVYGALDAVLEAGTKEAGEKALLPGWKPGMTSAGTVHGMARWRVQMMCTMATGVWRRQLWQSFLALIQSACPGTNIFRRFDQNTDYLVWGCKKLS